MLKVGGIIYSPFTGEGRTRCLQFLLLLRVDRRISQVKFLYGFNDSCHDTANLRDATGARQSKGMTRTSCDHRRQGGPSKGSNRARVMVLVNKDHYAVQ